MSEEEPFYCKIRLIRNGRSIETIEVTAPFDIMYADKEDIKEQKFYYRIEIETQGLLGVTNPVFVSRTGNSKTPMELGKNNL